MLRETMLNPALQAREELKAYKHPADAPASLWQALLGGRNACPLWS